MCSKELYRSKLKEFSDGCHTLILHAPSLKAKKQLSILSPIPSLNSTFCEWSETDDGQYGISPCDLVFERWSIIGHCKTNPFQLLGDNC